MTVVVGLGTTPLAELAIERAVREAKGRGLPLVVVAPVTMPRGESAESEYRELRTRTEAEANRRAAKLAETHSIECTAFVPSIPADLGYAVLRAAEEVEAELIVVGVRRRSPVGKAVLGSDSQTILLGANCEVLSVKLPDEAETRR